MSSSENISLGAAPNPSCENGNDGNVGNGNPSDSPTPSLAFFTQSLPCPEVNINDRFVECAESLLDDSGKQTKTNITRLNFDGFQGSAKIPCLQCVISSGYIACLLEDSRICRIPYQVTLNTGNDETSPRTGGNNTNSNSNPSNNNGNSSSGGASGGGSTGSVRTSSSLSTVPFLEINRSRAQALRRRLMRNPRPRGSQLTSSTRNVFPSLYVPEDLIAQAQAVLTGRSRNAILRELQRTNLDVNSAVYNLLSRDDDDVDEDPEVFAQEELMSLLASNDYDDGLFVSRSDSDFASLPSLHSSTSWFTAAIREDQPLSSTDLADMVTRNRLFPRNSASSNNGTSRTSATTTQRKETKTTEASNYLVSFTGLQEFWPLGSEDRKFVAISALHSELVALTDKGQLCQWRWADPEPFKGQLSDGTLYYHPKVLTLGLLQEKVTLLDSSIIRASVVTKTGKLATWIDESVAPLVIKLEHVATANLFDSQGSIKIRNLMVSSLMSAVQLSNGSVYWWGIPPFAQRMKNAEKAHKVTKNAKTSTSTSKPSKKHFKDTELVEGSFVRLASSPLYREGAIAFTTVSGVPQVGQLINNVTHVTGSVGRKCSLRIFTPAEIQMRFQSSNSSIAMNARALNVSDLRNPALEMPPPPSPASSTCSDNSIQPSAKRVKHNSNLYSIPASEMTDSKNEEFNFEDLIFVEDSKNWGNDIGKVLKIDGDFVAVKLSSSASSPDGADIEQLMSECRIFQKKDLVAVRPESSGSGSVSYSNKMFDCFQRAPKRVNFDKDVQVLASTITNFNLHCIVKQAAGRCSYLIVNVVTGKIDKTFTMPSEFRPFNTTPTSEQCLLKLFSAGESEESTVIVCRDANGTLYPLEKNKADNTIREPLVLNIGPVLSVAISIHQLQHHSSDTKINHALFGVAFEQQYLMPHILKSNFVNLHEVLEWIPSLPNAHQVIYELCDGNRNIFHMAVSRCFPKRNNFGSQNNSIGASLTSPFLNQNDTFELPVLSTPISHDEQNPDAHRCLLVLLNSHVLYSHLFTMLTARNFQGFTPFMMAVSGRAYTAATYLFLFIHRVAKTMSLQSKDTYNEIMAQMIYPKGSSPDHSPLYMLCTNDTCSFTWTGQEHINQDIFECKTCGLVGSLCCCTECARTCHRGHDCKLKRTSPTAYCDCWEKCKCTALIAGAQSVRFHLLELLLTTTDLSSVLNSRGENIVLHLLTTSLRQLNEQKQFRMKKNLSIRRSDRSNNDNSQPTMPDHNLDPPKFARRALERICRDWNTVKGMLLTGYRSFKADSNSYLNFYNGTATAFAHEEENYFLSRQDGTAVLDKFMHLLLSTHMVEFVRGMNETIVLAITSGKEDSDIVAKRYIRSVGRVYLTILNEINPNMLRSPFVRPSTAQTEEDSFQDYLNCFDLVFAENHKKLLPIALLMNCRRCFAQLMPIAIQELSEIAESLIAPVRLGLVKASDSFWLVNNNGTDCIAAQTLEVSPSVFAHQRDFIDPNTVDLPNDTASAQGASSLQDNVFDEPEASSQALQSDRNSVSASASQDGDDPGNAGIVRDSDSDSDSNHDDNSYLSNADNASMAQRSVVTGATAGSDVGIAFRLFDDESMNSNAEDGEDDDEDDRDDDENEEQEEDGSSIPETEGNTDDEHESSSLLNVFGSSLPFSSSNRANGNNNTSSASTTGNGTNNNGTQASNNANTSNTRRTGLPHIQWAFDQISSAPSRSAVRRNIGTYTVSAMPAMPNHDADISIPNATVGLSRSFSIITRVVADLLSMIRDPATFHGSKSMSMLLVSPQEIVSLHQLVEERFSVTWTWLINIMNSCEGQLRFGCSVSQRRVSPVAPVPFSSSGTTTSNQNSAANQPSRRRIAGRNFQNSAIQRMHGFLRRVEPMENRTGVVNSTVENPTSNPGTSTNNIPPLLSSYSSDASAVISDSDRSKLDFLAYSMSLMREHFDEHYDSLPVLDANSYRHVAYIFDVFSYFMRGGRFGIKAAVQRYQDFSNNQGVVTRNDPFYQRPRSTLFIGCPPPDPFSVSHSDALPLSAKPHLLKPNARKEDLFGIPRPGDAEEAKSYLQSLPCQMGLSQPLQNAKQQTSRKCSNFPVDAYSADKNIQNFNKTMALCFGSAKQDDSLTTNKKKTETIEKKISEYQKEGNHQFYFLNMNQFDNLLGNWRLALELFGKLFHEDVGAEESSILIDLAGFAIKEARFRREMDHIRRGSSIKELAFTQIDRDRHLLLKQSFEELNRFFKERSESRSNYGMIRLKVTFKDEPGEGAGVSRSFLTTFADAALSYDRFTSMDWLDARLRNEVVPRFFRRNQPLRAANPRNDWNNISRVIDSLTFRLDGPNFQNQWASPIGTQLFNRISEFQPRHALRITGMLMESPTESLQGLLDSDTDLRHAINVSMDLLGFETPEDTSQVFNSTPSEGDENSPLFHQPGNPGFYSPIVGKPTEARLNAFRNVGRIMGICFQQGDLIGISLNRHVISQILGFQPTWHDLAFFDHNLYDSFRTLINDASQPNAEEIFAEMDLRFSVDHLNEDSGKEHDLIPDGRNVRVTPNNVLEYVRAYSLHRMVTSQLPAIEQIRSGIFDVIPRSTLRNMTPEDFRLLLNGIPDISVQVLQSYVTFTDESGGQATANDLTYFRRWFWWVIEHMNPEERQDLMFFWTGSPSLHSVEPEGAIPIPSVTIRPQDDNYFVTSNTCISRLYVPLYSSRANLRQKLLTSIKDKTFSFI